MDIHERNWKRYADVINIILTNYPVIKMSVINCRVTKWRVMKSHQATVDSLYQPTPILWSVVSKQCFLNWYDVDLVSEADA